MTSEQAERIISELATMNARLESPLLFDPSIFIIVAGLIGAWLIFTA